MRSISFINPVVRATVVIGAVAALVTGVTFAALQSSVTYTGSQFTTATASLKIWDGDSYEGTTTGFNFANVVPGVETAATTFWLKNEGGVPLTVTSLGNTPTLNNIADQTKVKFNFKNITDASGVTTYTLAQLTDATPDPLPSGEMDAGDEEQYEIKVMVETGAVSGSSASMTNLDLTFTGTQPETP
jgi:hypothetical protein